MTAHFQPPHERQSGFWDAAAGGIFPGLLGGLVMLVILIVGGYLSGHTPAEVMGAFDTTAGHPLRGALIHFAVSSVYGALYAILIRGLVSRLRSPRSNRSSGNDRSSWSLPLPGLAYGLLLWLVAVTLLRQAAASLLTAIPAEVFLLGHLGYGLTLGLAAARQVASLSPRPVEISGRRNF